MPRKPLEPNTDKELATNHQRELSDEAAKKYHEQNKARIEARVRAWLDKHTGHNAELIEFDRRQDGKLAAVKRSNLKKKATQ